MRGAAHSARLGVRCEVACAGLGAEAPACRLSSARRIEHFRNVFTSTHTDFMYLNLIYNSAKWKPWELGTSTAGGLLSHHSPLAWPQHLSRLLLRAENTQHVLPPSCSARLLFAGEYCLSFLFVFMITKVTNFALLSRGKLLDVC